MVCTESQQQEQAITRIMQAKMSIVNWTIFVLSIDKSDSVDIGIRQQMRGGQNWMAMDQR